MKILYYSAAVKLKEKIKCVIGMQVLTTKEEVTIEQMECLYRFMVERYFGHVRVMAFGQTDKESFELKTNITITAKY
uniref:Uncharacterized protein n=1 Tax=Microviridae sp. ctuZ46 TaxID=2825010 RepID=A0A8S5UVN7_9VIRU|nr:MAG TPA: hypothetical protein [Microviridae sp. ctuZ46]